MKTHSVADYALIGDCRTAALVHRQGAVAWMCWPDFDSAPQFASLLGSESDGHWTVKPTSVFEVERRYLPDTLVLETTFRVPAGVAQMFDFMLVDGPARGLVRLIRGREGTVHLASTFASCNFALPRNERALRTTSSFGADGLHLYCSQDRLSVPFETDFTVASGEQLAFALLADPPRESLTTFAEDALRQCVDYWRNWVAGCTYSGPWKHSVLRSLITLKALIHAPTGGMVAAPTTSLPEFIGGTRNWDYRYCWLRDSTFAVLALMQSGYQDEASRWIEWLLRTIEPHRSRIQPLYAVDGRSDLDECEIGWLPGFANSRPVRIGNNAYRQLQLGVFGELQDTLYQWHCDGQRQLPHFWQAQRGMMEQLLETWREPDSGIWEQRSRREYFTQSRAMVWAAFDRAIRTAERLRLEAPLANWRNLRDVLRDEICTKGFDESRNAFIRAYGSQTLDASALLVPTLGILPPEDPRFSGTVEAIRNALGHGAFVYRYDQTLEDDGLGNGEGAFLPCSFWLADNLVLQKREDDAAALLEAAMGAANDLGLMSEEYDPASGVLLGNFPQALCHLALIHTALNLTGNGPVHARTSREGRSNG